MKPMHLINKIENGNKLDDISVFFLVIGVAVGISFSFAGSSQEETTNNFSGINETESDPPPSRMVDPIQSR
jgi:hypothetical protein